MCLVSSLPRLSAAVSVSLRVSCGVSYLCLLRNGGVRCVVAMTGLWRRGDGWRCVVVVDGVVWVWVRGGDGLSDLGSKSGLAKGNLKEGDRDPISGRLILDPLKIPTAEQGAPGTWAEYLAMRKVKEGGSARDFAVPVPSMTIAFSAPHPTAPTALSVPHPTLKRDRVEFENLSINNYERKNRRE